MDKFLSIPVTGQTNKFLLSASDIISVTRTNGTTTVITYNSANTATIVHTDVGSGAALSYFVRDSFQDQIVEALSTAWTEVAFPFVLPSSSVDPAGGTTPLGQVAIASITIA